MNNVKKLSIAVATISIFGAATFVNFQKTKNLPIVAIANYGPHSSLDASIQGVRDELEKQGFIEGKNLIYEIANVGFDPSLIPQMITKLKSQNPKVMVVMTTPVAQFAKGSVKNIPLIYNDITDPIEAGLLKSPHEANGNMTGSSDKQDIKLLLEFAKKLIPNSKTVGILYSTAESNDAALVKMMRTAAYEIGMKVIAIPVDQARDIPTRMQEFKGKVDFIYVGTSGPIQPALPVIAAEGNKMKIPVLNVDEKAVKDKMVLASFGVDYRQVGVNAGKLVAGILKGTAISKLTPLYPGVSDHHGFVSKKKALELGLLIPKNLKNVEIVE